MHDRAPMRKDCLLWYQQEYFRIRVLPSFSALSPFPALFDLLRSFFRGCVKRPAILGLEWKNGDWPGGSDSAILQFSDMSLCLPPAFPQDRSAFGLFTHLLAQDSFPLTLLG